MGINLNPDKACNFDCVYCQVDRTVPPLVRKVEIHLLREELERTIAAVLTGSLFEDPQFAGVPATARRLNDIAFSGDGEPTASPQFPEAVRLVAEVRQRLGLEKVKIVLITDATYLTRPAVRTALALMDASNGEIWAKLDAGTEEYFRLVNRPNCTLQTILENILDAARTRPIVIQSLWMNVHGQPPPDAEVGAFSGRLRDLVVGGGSIKLVQIYTIARRTAVPWVTPLDDAVLHRLADRVRDQTSLPVAVFGN
ncbi:MAG: hypothetical protein AMXMBFR13_27440 [Phycisphaerae bacterium]